MVLDLAAAAAALQQQPVLARAVPPRRGELVLRRHVAVARTDLAQRVVAHRSTPSSTVAWWDRIPPVPCASATSAPVDLPGSALAAQLAHRLDEQQDAELPGMAVRQAASGRVERHRPSRREGAGGGEHARLARRGEPERLEREQHRDGERVVDLRHVDVRRREPGAREGGCARGRRTGVEHVVGSRHRGVAGGLAVPEEHAPGPSPGRGRARATSARPRRRRR